MHSYHVRHEWDEASQIVMNGLKAFNSSFVGSSDERKLSVIVRNDQDAVIGGLLGQTTWGWMYIGWVWVEEAQRNRGIGRTLMAKAESAARELSCHHAHLTTLDFQARGFYESLGYEVFATLDDYPQGHQRFLMKKALSAA